MPKKIQVTLRLKDDTFAGRMFEGEVRWYIHEGVLSISRMNEAAGCGEPFISYAHGQWVSVEYVT